MLAQVWPVFPQARVALASFCLSSATSAVSPWKEGLVAVLCSLSLVLPVSLCLCLSLSLPSPPLSSCLLPSPPCVRKFSFFFNFNLKLWTTLDDLISELLWAGLSLDFSKVIRFSLFEYTFQNLETHFQKVFSSCPWFAILGARHFSTNVRTPPHLDFALVVDGVLIPTSRLWPVTSLSLIWASGFASYIIGHPSQSLPYHFLSRSCSSPFTKLNFWSVPQHPMVLRMALKTDVADELRGNIWQHGLLFIAVTTYFCPHFSQKSRYSCWRNCDISSVHPPGHGQAQGTVCDLSGLLPMYFCALYAKHLLGKDRVLNRFCSLEQLVLNWH